MRLHIIAKLAMAVACPTAIIVSAQATGAQTLCSANPQQNVRLGVDSDSQNMPVFLLNGQPWMPRGLQIRGFVSALATAQSMHTTDTINARNAYGQTELDAAVDMFNADMLRIQVSQGDLDPEYDPPGTQPAGYKTNYRDSLMKAFTLARNNCFVVIISMQAEQRSGYINRSAIPSESTRRAWANLLSGDDGAGLAADQGIMLEIYNEPGGSATDDNWSRWAHAADGKKYGNATDPTTGEKLYGMQPLITWMRQSRASGGLGSDNILIVDGLEIADTFKGVDSLVNPLVDPISADNYQVAYAVHPYLRIVTDVNPRDGKYDSGPPDYGVKWGFLQKAGANGRPPAVVFSSEWSAQETSSKTKHGLGLGYPKNTYEVTRLLNFMITNRVPMSAGAFDIPKIMVQEIPVGDNPPVRGFWVPTNYDNYDQNNCSNSGNDAGLFIQTMFNTMYSRQLVESDGKTANQSTKLWCN